jgi:hypothetical protein
MLAAVVAWFLGTVLRLAPGEVRVSAEGVLHRSLTATHFVPWYAVFDVTAEFAGTPLIVVKAHTSDGTRLRRHTGRLGTAEMQFLPYLVVRVPWLAADPVEVYRTLTFYAAHADRRSDLATGAQPGFATDVGREA